MPHRAFTIVEILAVVMIIAIAGMVGAWSFYQNSDSTILRNSSRQLLAAVQSARLPAAQLHYPSQLHINLDDQSYHITALQPNYSALLADSSLGSAANTPTQTNRNILDLGLDTPKKLQDGVIIKQVRYSPKNSTDQYLKDSGTVTINFYPDGIADAAIIQVSRNNIIESVVISPCTLRAQLRPGAIEQLPIDIIDLN